MKYLIILFGFVLPLNVLAEDFISPTYEIAMRWNCSEGNVTCDDIEIKLANRTDNRFYTAVGKSRHSVCADGVTPCQFQGYEFMIGELNYFLHVDGLIEVVHGKGKLVISEQGEWKD